jgi:hypothetical protein
MSGRGIRPTRGGSIRSLTGSQHKSQLLQGKTIASLLPTTTGSSLSGRVANDQASDKRSTRSTGTDELAGSGRPVRRVRLPNSDDEDAEDIHSPAGIRARRYAHCTLLIMLISLSRTGRATTAPKHRSRAASNPQDQPASKHRLPPRTSPMTHTFSSPYNHSPSSLRRNRGARSQRRYTYLSSSLRRARESGPGSAIWLTTT